MSGLEPPEHLSDEQVTYWKELVNRVHAAVDATDTPTDPTMDQIEALAERAVAEDPDVGFDELPDGWDASTVAEVWSKVGGSFTACKTKFMTEEGWSEGKANRFCATLKDEVKNSEQWREGGGEDPAGGPLSMVPGVPSDPDRITREMLEDIVKWKMAQLRERAATAASLPPIRATLHADGDWNPSLHPRDPDTGQFVERPWPADALPDDVNDAPTHDLVKFLGETPGSPDMNRILSSDEITIDGIPDDVDSVDELKQGIQSPERNVDVPSNPKSVSELDKGDIIRTADGPARVENTKPEDGAVLVERPDGELDDIQLDDRRRNTFDVYEVDSMDELPSQGGGTPDNEASLGTPVGELPQSALGEELGYNGAEKVSEGDLVIADGKLGMVQYSAETTGTVGVIFKKSGAFTDFSPARDDMRKVDKDAINLVDRGRADWGEMSVTDPEGGRFVQNSINDPDVGDIIRFEGPDGDLQIGQVTNTNDFNDPLTVELPDGDTVKVGTRFDTPDRTYDGQFIPSDTGVSEDMFVTPDDIQARDLTEMDGSPAERREKLAGEFLSDDPIPEAAVLNEQIPEGAVIARQSGTTGTVFPAKVEGYEDTNTGKKLVVTTASGSKRQLSAGSVEKDYRPYKPEDIPEVTVPDNKWGDEDTPLAQRKRNLKGILDDILPQADASPDGNEDGNLDPESFEETKEVIAKQLARSKDKAHAEKVMARLTSIGQIGRAHAVGDFNVWGPDTAYFSVSNDEDHEIIVHELGHAVGDIYGFKGGNNDMDGETYPMTDFAWQSPDYDVPQKYGISTPAWSDDFEQGTRLSEQPTFNIDEWGDEVERQVGKGLDGRNFTSVEDKSDIPHSDEANGMIRFEDTPSYGDPKNWKITYYDGTTIELEDKEGRQVHGEVKNDAIGDGVLVTWPTNSEFVGSSKVAGSRKSQPDNWREDPPDADEWLGSMNPDGPTDAARSLGNMVNKAWYRQAYATREHGATRDLRTKYALKDGYSSKQAHETMSRIHHVLRATDDVTNTELAEAAYTLVNYHPDLLEAYTNLYDLPTTTVNALNAVLEREGKDFRFDGGTDLNPEGVETVKDIVQEKYEEGDFE